jgi:hypothetical protein
VYISFIASFLKLYVIEPVDPKGWSLPQAVFAAGVALPKNDVRVKIRTRDYNMEGKEVNVKVVDEKAEDEKK